MANLVEILKDAPKGTVLYSPVFGECAYQMLYIGDLYPIEVIHDNGDSIELFTEDGKCYEEGECLLFPSKGHRSWNNWQAELFKYGDYIAFDAADGSSVILRYTVGITGEAPDRSSIFIELPKCRYATKEQIAMYEDRAARMTADTHTTEEKFTIADFKPFDKVLVRDCDSDDWKCNIYSHHYDNETVFVCVNCSWKECIPYNEETRHLIGTANDCPQKYKTW